MKNSDSAQLTIPWKFDGRFNAKSIRFVTLTVTYQ